MQALVMRQHQLGVAFFMLCSIVLRGATFAQEGEQRPTIGKLVVQTIPAKQYLQGGFETDFKSMGEPVVKTLTEMMEAAKGRLINNFGISVG